jgi:hypothetical protein
MKATLKTFPRIRPETTFKDWIDSTYQWRDDFEAELREIMINNKPIEKITFIQEILGE